MRTRGKRVTAEATIPRDVLIQNMRVEPEQLHYHAQVANVGAFLSGANNNGAHSPNGITAMFIATGQDVANVSESSAGIVYTEITPDGALYISITIPSLIVATHGGGTGLATQRECLEILGCTGRGKVRKFAEIVAGVVLAGEISLASAISSLDWVSSPREVRTQPLVERTADTRRRAATLRPGERRPGRRFSAAGRDPAAGSRRPLLRHPEARPRPDLRRLARLGAQPHSRRFPRGYGLARFAASAPRPFLDQELLRAAVPGPAAPAPRDPRPDLHQARPGPLAARGHPARPDHRRAQEPARPPAGGAARPPEGDRREGPRSARWSRCSPGSIRIRSARPRSARCTTRAPRRPRGHPQGGQARQPRDAAARHHPAQSARPLPADLPGAHPAAEGAARSSPTTRCASSISAARPTTPRLSPPTSATCRTSSSRRSTASSPAATCCAWSSSTATSRPRPRPRRSTSRAARSRWSTSAPRRSSGCSTATASSTPTCTPAT